jgi:hypothetical protein
LIDAARHAARLYRHAYRSIAPVVAGFLASYPDVRRSSAFYCRSEFRSEAECGAGREPR